MIRHRPARGDGEAGVMADRVNGGAANGGPEGIGGAGVRAVSEEGVWGIGKHGQAALWTGFAGRPGALALNLTRGLLPYWRTD